MPEELLIDVSPFESRVALVKDGAVEEVHLARAAGYSSTGNIYLGKVVRVIPGMQAAFVDIGLERPGFLHASDISRALWQRPMIRMDIVRHSGSAARWTRTSGSGSA